MSLNLQALSDENIEIKNFGFYHGFGNKITSKIVLNYK